VINYQSGAVRGVFIILSLIAFIVIFRDLVPTGSSTWSGWAGSVVGTLVGGVLAVLVFLYQARQQFDDERKKRLAEVQAEYRQLVQARAIRVANEVKRTMFAVAESQLVNLQSALWTPGLADQGIGALEQRLSTSVSRYYDALNEFRLLRPAGGRADEKTASFLVWFDEYEARATAWIDALEEHSIVAVGALISLRQHPRYMQKVEEQPYSNRHPENARLVQQALEPLKSSHLSAPAEDVQAELVQLFLS